MNNEKTVRYPNSVQPVSTDGRDVSLDLAQLSGEAADQRSTGGVERHLGEEVQLWQHLPQPDMDDPTYYDRPLLQAPVWEWAVPVYYYVGSVTGGALALGAAAQMAPGDHFKGLIRWCHWIGFVGASLSGGLLVYDLGRPARFLNMMRVFRPTSPMNMGVWILSATSAAAAATVVLHGRGGFWGGVGSATGVAAGFFGLGLATYTGVLVGNSAIPIWQEARAVLPTLFGSSALVGVGSFFDFLPLTPAERRATTLMGNAGRVAELAAVFTMEARTSVVPEVGRPLRSGLTGALWHAATVLTASSLLLSVWPRSGRKMRIASGLFGTAGSLLMRFMVAHAGTVSARDAKASFHQQRAGHGGAEVTGRAARVGPTQ